MYAVVRTGGKQYRVQQGSVLEVERLDSDEGTSIDLHEVLLIEDDGTVTVGAPTIVGAKVVADVVAHDRGDKIIVQKYKAKVRYRRRIGHRQQLTRLAVREIVLPQTRGGRGRAQSTSGEQA